MVQIKKLSASRMSTNATSSPGQSPPMPVGRYSHGFSDMEDSEGFRPSYQPVPRNSLASSVSSAISLFSSKVAHPTKWWVNTLEGEDEVDENETTDKEEPVQKASVQATFQEPIAAEAVNEELVSELVELASQQQKALSGHRQKLVDMQNKIEEDRLNSLLSQPRLSRCFSLPSQGHHSHSSSEMLANLSLIQEREKSVAEPVLQASAAPQPVSMLPRTPLNEPSLLLAGRDTNPTRAKPHYVERKVRPIRRNSDAQTGSETAAEWRVAVIKLLPVSALTETVIRNELEKPIEVIAESAKVPTVNAPPKQKRKAAAARKLQEQRQRVATMWSNFGRKMKRH